VIRILHENYEEQPIDGGVTYDDLTPLTFGVIWIVVNLG